MNEYAHPDSFGSLPSDRVGKNIAAAFVKAQAAMTNPKKDADNPFFKSKYADLTSCWLACKAALAANEIAVMQGVFGDRLRTTLVHSSGETMSDEGVPLNPAGAKAVMQGWGSAITYARRFGLCAMLGMAPEDDDGNSLIDNHPMADMEPDGPATITGDQAKELNALADEVGADKPAFCKYLGVDSIADIHPNNFQMAKDALERKRKAAA